MDVWNYEKLPSGKKREYTGKNIQGNVQQKIRLVIAAGKYFKVTVR